MNGLNTTLLQQLVQASNRSKAEEKALDEKHLHFIAYLFLKLKESEMLIDTVSHQKTQPRNFADLV